MSGEGASGGRGREIRHKHLETDVIDPALDLVLFREERVDGIRSLAGTGGVENYFDEHPDW